MEPTAGRWMAVVSLAVASALPAIAQGNAFLGATYEGAGCPQGSVNYRIENDGARMILNFDAFIAIVGPGVPQGEETKDCRIDLTMQTGDRAVLATETRGLMNLDRDMAGAQIHQVQQTKPSIYGFTLEVATTGGYITASSAVAPVRATRSGNTFSLTLRSELDNELNAKGKGALTVDTFELRLVP